MQRDDGKAASRAKIACNQPAPVRKANVDVLTLGPAKFSAQSHSLAEAR